MKKSNRSYQMYLEDIQLAMQRIAEYIGGYTFSDFKKDFKTVDAVIRNFEIIGEASKNLPETIKDKYSNIPWKEMYLLRNKVSYQIEHKMSHINRFFFACMSLKNKIISTAMLIFFV